MYLQVTYGLNQVQPQSQQLSDPAISLSSNNLVVADGTTYVLTTGDVINYIVY